MHLLLLCKTKQISLLIIIIINLFWQTHMHNAEISFDLIFPCLACYVNNITQKAEPFSVLLNQFSRSKEKSTSKHLYCKKKASVNDRKKSFSFNDAFKIKKKNRIPLLWETFLMFMTYRLLRVADWCKLKHDWYVDVLFDWRDINL